ncbi:ligand-gated ion channel [Mangrovicoccus algicola]|uniref:Neurotransmitter-gated ion-channel ligand-binding domain-containing protein n=1 Tax=Mangrovicoccus algicola TaxID=2771008 RepID=A0A8J6YTX2_9RHOB|nr:hypothetical protein [Mangrovicoccus algicola]MBE3639183.1 hypothetical protein [Mangrovicoccus algicola]
MRRQFGGLALLLWITFLPALALADCLPPQMRTDERPPGEGPTEVTIGFALADFLGVNDVDQNIDVDLRMIMEWTDPRLAGQAGCRFGVAEVWFPPVLLGNSASLREAFRITRNQVSVGEGGRVRYVQRYTGWISSYHRLDRFPFDRQDFEIRVLAPDLTADELVLVPAEVPPRIAARLNVEGWEIGGASLSAQPQQLTILDHPASVASLTLHAEREATYYIYRILLPLSFVVAMSWAIFWGSPERFEFRIGLGATAMLTAIAFSLSIAGQLPQLGYLTLMDKMLIWAVGLVFLSMAESLVSWLMNKGWDGRPSDKRGARRLDRVSRWLFPVLLFGGWAVICLL